MKVLRTFLFLIYVVNSHGQCPPDLFVTNGSRTLTCNSLSLLATASSSTSNTQISWLTPSAGVLYSPSVIIGAMTGPDTSRASLFYADYTVVATNTLLNCSTSSVLTFYQRYNNGTYFWLYPYPGMAICDGPITLGAATMDPNGDPPGTTYTVCWSGPAPFTPTCGPGVIQCIYPGLYSASLIASYNGCAATKTINIVDSRPQYSVSFSAPITSISCNGSLSLTPFYDSNFTLTSNQGNINGFNISNLCYGLLKYCLRDQISGCSKCDSILINETTHLHENSSPVNFSISPNPASSMINIETNTKNSSQFIMYTLLGIPVANFLLQNGSESFQLPELPEGVYFITSMESGIMKKLVIRH